MSILAYGAEALRRLSDAPLTEQQRFLLGECVEAYADVPQDKLAEFWRILEANSTEGVRAVNKTRYEMAVERAERAERAIRVGQLELLEAQVVSRFGLLGEDILAKLRALPDTDLRRIAVQLLKANSLAELGL